VTKRSCSFCHELNDEAQDLCLACGHQAHVPRLACSCPQCSKPLKLTASSVLHDLEEQMRLARLQNMPVDAHTRDIWIALVSAVRATLSD